MRRALASALVFALLLPVIPAAATGVPADSAEPDPAAPAGVIVVYRDDVMDTTDFSALEALGVEPMDVSVRRPRLSLVDVPEDTTAEELARRLTGLPGVAAATPNGRVQALEMVPPNDTRYMNQRTYLGPNDTYPHSIDVESVWGQVFSDGAFALEPDRKGVTLAVIDSGVSASAMEDPGSIVPVMNYVAGNTDTSDDFSPQYHGTRVASTLGSQTGNAYAVAGTLGYTRSPIRVYKTLARNGYGESIDSMTALMDAADDGVRIANVSLGEPATLYGSLTPDTALRGVWQEVVDYCVSQGMLVVAAAGNGADPSSASGYFPGVWYPAACEGALAVGAIDPATGTRSIFSSFGDELDVVAPGEDILAAGPNGATYTVRGTSFASPLVAGALGMLWSLVPSLDPATIAQIATSSADSGYGDRGFDQETGWGRFDAWDAYCELTSTVPAQAPVTIDPGTPSGLAVGLKWSAAQGQNVRYRYGVLGGREYQTTGTSGTVLLPAGGEQTVWVRPYADDRFDGAITTATVTADGSIPALTVDRAQGDDRYATAAQVSRAHFPGPVQTVVVASGENWPDGLSASVLAKAGGGPLLITKQASLPVATRDEILRLAPTRVIVVGGTSAVSSAVFDTLKALQYPRAVAFERIGGVSRYDTAALVAARIKSLSGGATPEAAIVTSGANYPDALSIAPLAASEGWPILLTTPNAVPTSTSRAVRDLGVPGVLVIGGTKAVSNSVAWTLPSPTRVSGANRYATSRAIADWGIAHGRLDGGHLGVATGVGFPDSLTAGPALALDAAPLLLTDPSDTGLTAWMLTNGTGVDALSIFGGPVAVGYDAEITLGQALRGR